MDRAEKGNDDGAVAELQWLNDAEQVMRRVVGDEEGVVEAVPCGDLLGEVPGEEDGREGCREVGDRAGEAQDVRLFGNPREAEGISYNALRMSAVLAGTWYTGVEQSKQAILWLRTMSCFKPVLKLAGSGVLDWPDPSKTWRTELWLETSSGRGLSFSWATFISCSRSMGCLGGGGFSGLSLSFPLLLESLLAKRTTDQVTGRDARRRSLEAAAGALRRESELAREAPGERCRIGRAVRNMVSWRGAQLRSNHRDGLSRVKTRKETRSMGRPPHGGNRQARRISGRPIAIQRRYRQLEEWSRGSSQQ